jgi:hypothetical protein
MTSDEVKRETSGLLASDSSMISSSWLGGIIKAGLLLELSQPGPQNFYRISSASYCTKY